MRRSFSVGYEVKNQKLRDLKRVDVTYTIHDVETAKEAIQQADRSFFAEGFKFEEYKKKRTVTEVDGAPTPAPPELQEGCQSADDGTNQSVAQANEQHSDLMKLAANMPPGSIQAVDGVVVGNGPIKNTEIGGYTEPGHHPQLDAMYGLETKEVARGKDTITYQVSVEDPTPDPAVKIADLAEHNQGAGSSETVAEVDPESPGAKRIENALLYGTSHPEIYMDTIEAQIEDINDKIRALLPGERLRLEDVPATVYHQSKGYGSSAIKLLIDECPLVLRDTLDGKIKRSEDKYTLGSATHDRLLLPDVFEDEYVVQPKKVLVDGEEVPLRVRNGKAWEACKAMHPNQTIITQEQHDQAEGMREAFLRDKGGFFTGGAAEVSYWYHCPETGLILKARPDYERGDLGIDAKTTGSVNPASIDKLFYNLKYYVQEAHYKYVTGLNKYVFVFVSTSYPHYTNGPAESVLEMAELGDIQISRAYKELAYCEKMDEWAGYNDGYRQIELPYYGRKLLDELRGYL